MKSTIFKSEHEDRRRTVRLNTFHIPGFIVSRAFGAISAQGKLIEAIPFCECGVNRKGEYLDFESFEKKSLARLSPLGQEVLVGKLSPAGFFFTVDHQGNTAPY